jgi:hypothetical protein
MIFQVLMVASLKMTGLWHILPCSLVEVDRRFRGAYCLHSVMFITLNSLFKCKNSRF